MLEDSWDVRSVLLHIWRALPDPSAPRGEFMLLTTVLAFAAGISITA